MVCLAFGVDSICPLALIFTSQVAIMIQIFNVFNHFNTSTCSSSCWSQILCPADFKESWVDLIPLIRAQIMKCFHPYFCEFYGNSVKHLAQIIIIWKCANQGSGQRSVLWPSPKGLYIISPISVRSKLDIGHWHSSFLNDADHWFRVDDLDASCSRQGDPSPRSKRNHKFLDHRAERHFGWHS